DLLIRLELIDSIDERDPRLRHIHYDWLDACERTQATVRMLSDQLRRFLDDRAWLENRRIMDLLRSIGTTALELPDAPPPAPVIEVDGTAPEIVLPLERPLYAPPGRTPIDSRVEADGDCADTSALFDHVYVDRARLAMGVRRALQHRSRVGLTELVGE